jgi:hypothetical protein
VPPAPEIPPPEDRPHVSGVPSSPGNEPANSSVPPPLPAAAPPLLPSGVDHKSPLGHLFAMLLSLFVVLFLVDAVVSLADDSLILFFESHALTGIRGLLAPFVLLMAVVIYLLMGLTPMIPKRLFLPLTLFNPLVVLATLPLLIFFFNRIEQVACAISFYQVVLALFILHKVQGGFGFRWPVFVESQLHTRRFSWRNLTVFVSVNFLVLLPLTVGYSFFCARLAVDHFSDGFMALRSEGLIVQSRKYAHDDGKTIHLFPMAHVGDSEFYRELSQSFPTNATVLMEGVTDNGNLLTNRITYERMAATLGVAEQQKEFTPRGEMVHADVDVEVFEPSTIEFLNLVMLIHSKGVNAETWPYLMQYSESSQFQKQLFEDLLGKRNRHLLQEIRNRLQQSNQIIVPWGAAHMPEIGREIQKSGFRVIETQDHVAIRFGGGGNK